MPDALIEDFDMSMLRNHYGDSCGSQEKSRRSPKKLALTNTDLSVLGDVGHEWPELKIMGIVVSLRQKEESEFTVRYYTSLKE